ncbi:hypothetical protein Hamer_G015287 [Homarus americanus]|uniref:CUB domain-containing protein n=1 Tax=Homarus americanus TaxID=6706 RepID=A0A8J5TM03_HOMAM|nr:hypothetical protein Hamer_G015287 [Homarus americanus]
MIPRNMEMMTAVAVTVVVSTLLNIIIVASPSTTQSSVHGVRDGKFLNLQFLPFVTVKVQPKACSSKSDNSTGTCTSRKDCTSQGGRADGTCANGYGVCCVYQKKCGETVSQNCSYLVNDAYPDTFMTIDNCQYSIEKANENICQLRLDFETLRIQGPDNTTQCSEDTFTVVGTGGANPTVILYLDLASGTGAARVNIATTTTTFPRSWRIKVTQIPCSSPSRAPPNCLQYFSEYSGTIKSFNYQTTDGIHQLANQQYTACIRAREGFCGIKYTNDHFSMSLNASNPTANSTDSQCENDFVLIPVVSKDGTVSGPDRYCGSDFAELTTFSAPFEIRVVTDNAENSTIDVNNRGFSLRYTQIPC